MIASKLKLGDEVRVIAPARNLTEVRQDYTIMRLTSGRKKDFILHFPRIVERLENTTPPALRHG